MVWVMFTVLKVIIMILKLRFCWEDRAVRGVFGHEFGWA